MIYTVEIPNSRHPYCWVALDRAKFIELVEVDPGAENVYKAGTVREMLGEFGYSSFDEARAEGDDLTYLVALADQYGLDTRLYQAGAESDYTPEPIEEFDACCQWLSRDLHTLLVFESDLEAKRAAQDDNNWKCHRGIEAREELRNKLGIYSDVE